MTLATSPCPPWCRTDHVQYRSHGQVVGAVGLVTVMAFQYGVEEPTVQVGNRELGWWVEVPLSLVSAFDGVMALIGQARLGELVRRGGQLIGRTR